MAEAAKTKKKSLLFAKIHSHADALGVVREASLGFFVLAGLQAAVSFLLGFSILIDAVAYAVLGFLLRRFKSRAAAVLLLLLAGAGFISTIGNRMGAENGGGGNVFLACIVLWSAARAVEATFKLRGQLSEDDAYPATVPMRLDR